MEHKTHIAELLNQAELALKENKLEQEIACYKAVLKVENFNHIALINLTHSLIKLGDKKEAARYARLAYRLYGEYDPMAVVNYSCILFDSFQYETIVEILEEKKEEETQEPLVYNNLGFAYFHLNEFQKAIQNYNQSISLEELNPLAYCNRGILRYFILNEDEGVEDLKKAANFGDEEAVEILNKIIYNF